MSQEEWLKPQLMMRLPSLSDLPEPVLPPGAVLRAFTGADAAAWVVIINASFGSQHGPDWFQVRMGLDEAYRPERIWFVTVDAEPVGTASAWYRPSLGERCGVLHMVGLLPEYAGRGLGRAVCLAALAQMRAEGREAALLQTDDFRLPAIRTYLQLGFEPLPIHENQRERWRRVLPQVPGADHLARFEPVLSGPLAGVNEPPGDHHG